MTRRGEAGEATAPTMQGMPPSREPISWGVAERVAEGLARGRVLDESSRRELEDDFVAASAQAEELVSQATGLVPPAGGARVVVTDRAGWARANLESFRGLLAPLSARLGSRAVLPPPLSLVGPAATGAEIGAVLGLLSSRVLGQYDVLSGDRASEEGDRVYYVGPNVVGLEQRHGFAPREFRLWIALHEVTHRVQFTGVPWLRGYFLGLVERGLSFVAPDPRALLAGLRRAGAELARGRNPFERAGLVGVLATEEQLEVLRDVQALMSLLEGHGEVTMNRAARGLVPGADRFAAVLRARRAGTSGVLRVLQQLIGLEAKLKQYEAGARFVTEVERAGGAELFARVWESPEMLPSVEEIAEPWRWVARAGGLRDR